jgi:hypothetical protein
MSGLSVSTIRRAEDGQCHDTRLLLAIRSTLEQAGIEFIAAPGGEPAVRPVKGR